MPWKTPANIRLQSLSWNCYEPSDGWMPSTAIGKTLCPSGLHSSNPDILRFQQFCFSVYCILYRSNRLPCEERARSSWHACCVGNNAGGAFCPLVIEIGEVRNAFRQRIEWLGRKK
jgi:hypothetical protein